MHDQASITLHLHNIFIQNTCVITTLWRHLCFNKRKELSVFLYVTIQDLRFVLLRMSSCLLIVFCFLDSEQKLKEFLRSHIICPQNNFIFEMNQHRKKLVSPFFRTGFSGPDLAGFYRILPDFAKFDWILPPLILPRIFPDFAGSCG